MIYIIWRKLTLSNGSCTPEIVSSHNTMKGACNELKELMQYTLAVTLGDTDKYDLCKWECGFRVVLGDNGKMEYTIEACPMHGGNESIDDQEHALTLTVAGAHIFKYVYKTGSDAREWMNVKAKRLARRLYKMGVQFNYLVDADKTVINLEGPEGFNIVFSVKPKNG